MLTPEQRRQLQIGSPPFNGVEQRLEALLALQLQILDRLPPSPAAPDADAPRVLREPAAPSIEDQVRALIDDGKTGVAIRLLVRERGLTPDAAKAAITDMLNPPAPDAAPADRDLPRRSRSPRGGA
jgi:hypothetical protein